MTSSDKYIALFGFYKYGNFGDDLMAVLFGQELKSLGIPFRVYHLRPEVLAEFGFQGESCLETLLADAAAVAYGGGGVFLSSRHDDFDNTLKSLCSICSQRSIPIYIFSAGGDGKPAHYMSTARQELLRVASYTTFRNAEDAILLAEIGEEKGAIFEDVVWQTAAVFHPSDRSNPQITIGIDNSMLGSRSRRWPIQFLMWLCCLLQRPYRFVGIVQSTPESRHAVTSECIYYSSGMTRFINDVSHMDLVITRRLHLGMVAMSYDIPVLLYFPQPKSRMLFHRLGLGSHIFSSLLVLPRLFWMVIVNSDFRKLRPSQNVPDLQAIARNSENHFREMERVVQSALQP
jgi:polysaccharide pyruvyl transferase WcaK-like protein